MKKENTFGTNLSVTVNANTKFPLSYLLKIKRGVAWSLRRIELDRERVKYFKTEDNELRFSEKIEDCALVEKNINDLKKYFLLLVSKSGAFKEVKISYDDVKVLQNFKKDFDAVQNYKATISNIQNKTFLIEGASDKKIDIKKAEEEFNLNKNNDDQTVNQSIIDDNTTRKSLYFTTFDDQSILRKSVVLNNEENNANKTEEISILNRVNTPDKQSEINFKNKNASIINFTENNQENYIINSKIGIGKEGNPINE